MASNKEFPDLSWLSGFTKDTLHPTVKRSVPSILSVNPNGLAALYQRTSPRAEGVPPTEPSPLFPAQSEVNTSRIGEVHAFQDPIYTDTFYTFIEGGFNLRSNLDSGKYQYTIHPHFDVNASQVRELQPQEQHDILSGLDDIYPSIQVGNDPTCDYFSLKLLTHHGQRVQVTVTADGAYPNKYSDTPHSVIDRGDSVAVWVSEGFPLAVSTASGTQWFMPTTLAVLPKVTPEVKGYFEAFADIRNPDYENKRKVMRTILGKTRAGVSLRPFHPFPTK